jgi:hypothetical protein
MNSNWKEEMKSNPFRLFYASLKYTPGDEGRDFHCGFDCTSSCSECEHEVRCGSFGAHSACAGCEWRSGCLKELVAEHDDGRGNSGCLAG